MNNYFERDLDELEGALLPKAEPISESESGNDAGVTCATLTSAEASLPEATALPVGVFRDDGGYSERQKLAEAAFLGRIKTQQEIDTIKKESERSKALDIKNRWEIREANLIARQRNLDEESGATQTSLSTQITEPEIRLEPSEKSSHRLRKDCTPRTDGYQFGSYDIGSSYETKSYDVKEYKSVYDK